MYLRISSLAVLSVLLLACGNDPLELPGADAGPTGSDPIGSHDAAALPADGATGGTAAEETAFQAVLSNLALPTSGTDYADDIDGDGTPDNRLGAILGALGGLAVPGLDPQQWMDATLSSGAFLLLLDSRPAPAMPVDPGFPSRVLVETHLGEDQDGDPADNFSGDEPFALNPVSPAGMSFLGELSNGTLDVGPGTLMLPVPLDPSGRLLTVHRAHVWAKAQGPDLEGRFSGAVDWAAVDGSLLPVVATVIDDAYRSPLLDPKLKAILRLALDLNADGTITLDELRNSPVLGALIAPDVDLDGDGVAEAISLGVGFSSVGCVITS